MGNSASCGSEKNEKRRRHSDEVLEGAGAAAGNLLLWMEGAEWAMKHCVLHGTALYIYEKVPPPLGRTRACPFGHGAVCPKSWRWEKRLENGRKG